MSPAISFSGVTSRGPFWKLILIGDYLGQKTQTVREPRKRPIKQGDKLYLYWKQRVPAEKKPIHKIASAICPKIEPKRYADFAYDNQFAVADGFSDHYELQEWFGNPDIHGDKRYNVIHFKITDKARAFGALLYAMQKELV